MNSSKQGKQTKDNKFVIKLDTKFEESIKKYNVKDVFKINSSIKDKQIINGLIYIHKIFEYKCHSKKCAVKGEWLDNPLELLLIHINNKETDNRISNLTYNCYNCYFQNNSSGALFKKVKKEKILGCKICGFNLSKLSYTCKRLGICKICIEKNKTKNSSNGLELFSNTFNNSLTTDDLNQNKTNGTSVTINESMNYSLLLTDNTTDTDNTLEIIKNRRDKTVNKNKTLKNSKTSKNSSKGITNEICKQNDELTTTINLNDININDIKDIKALMNM